MAYFLLFLSEIAVLFFLSKKLINALSQIFFKLTRNHHTVINILAVLFLPGTIIHELSHLLTAGVLLVAVGEMVVFPQIQPDGVRLGSVQIGRCDPFRKMVIGVAPVLVGIFSILGILYFVQSQNHLIWWQIILGVILIFEISNTMFSSKKDLEGVIGFLVTVLVLTIIIWAIFYFLKPNLLQNIWLFVGQLEFYQAVKFFKQGSIYLLVPLSLDLMVILLASLIL